ncbi:hypothetical protein KQY30_33705 [Streptomyces sp. GMY02]|uniref:hypothetical protein n=1 Tax=Streptomyces sp. GMY02 TaxID=1333528 RepID=UPI001C2BF2FC|nr:hypothetical protein KQY30_33705 [Streptomyces sp. GMY02]
MAGAGVGGAVPVRLGVNRDQTPLRLAADQDEHDRLLDIAADCGRTMVTYTPAPYRAWALLRSQRRSASARGQQTQPENLSLRPRFLRPPAPPPQAGAASA